MNATTSTSPMQIGRVVTQHTVCDEHYRLTLSLPALPDAQPGQFVHLRPPMTSASGERGLAPADPVDRTPSADPVDRSPSADGVDRAPSADGPSVAWRAAMDRPFLRRAFSIARFERHDADGGARIDVIYRVVGKGTRWMASLGPGDPVDVLGPLGNGFEPPGRGQRAYLVAGGVGLPPMLFFAERLAEAGVETVAFFGARSANLLALDRTTVAPAIDAAEATLCCEPPTSLGIASVVATDDGSLGFAGHIGAALLAYHHAHPPDPTRVVIYACGPERMLQTVARDSEARNIACYLCMERAMACGLGTCQSCVVPVTDPSALDGWRYALCCRDGPVFPANQIVWNP